jgi:tRNA threonylcarbamoyladenosine biosynthesis protein TsaB
MPFDPAPRDAHRVGQTVLAIDTTAGLCSVALLGPRGEARRAEPMTHGHSRHVLGLVGAVLDEAGVAPGEIAAIGFGSGPGSFTGLRIACGVAQGLGFGWSVPLVPVDAMRTLALQASLASPEAPGPVLVALDLRMGEVCVAAFDPFDPFDGAAWPTPSRGPALASPERAIEAFDAHGGAPLLAGDGFDAYPALGAWVRQRGAARAPTAIQPDASAVARLALAGLRAGLAVDAAQAAPTYLRDKVALDVGEQAALRAARAAGAAR